MRPAGPRRAARAFDGWLFAPGRPADLWVVRTGLATLIGVRLAIGLYPDLASQPAALFQPPPLVAWLDRMPPVEVLVAVQVVGVVLAALAVAGRWPRMAFAGALAAFVFLEALIAARGKVSHNEVLTILVAAPVLLSPRGLSFRDRSPDRLAGFPRRTALLVFALGYFFSGFQKVVSSGWSWVTSDNLEWVLVRGSRSSMSVLPDLAGTLADLPLVPQLIALSTLVVELGMLAVPFVRRLRVPAFACILALHLTIFLILGLDYFSWVLVGAIVLLPWVDLADRVRPGASGPLPPADSSHGPGDRAGGGRV